MYITKKAKTIAKMIGIFARIWDGILWATIGLSLAYLVWLALFKDLLEPVLSGGSVIKLDLLQTLAFLAAVTALEGTVVVAAINKVLALATEINVTLVQDIGDVNEYRPSRLRRAIDLGVWLWCLVQVALAILILRQGVTEASLCYSSPNATSIEIGGWLAAASAGSWVVLVLVASSIFVYLYAEVRHVVTIMGELKKANGKAATPREG